MQLRSKTRLLVCRQHMKEKPKRKMRAKRLTTRQKNQLAAPAALPDSKIETREMPEARDWSSARRGMFYHPKRRAQVLPSIR